MAWSPVHRLCIQSDKPVCEKVTEFTDLLQFDPHCVTSLTATGATPLHLACTSENEFAVCFLLVSCKVPVNPQNENGETPLHWACQHQNIKIVTLLLNHGAKLSILDKKRQSPLQWALEQDSPNLEIIQLLQSRIKHVLSSPSIQIHKKVRSTSLTHQFL